MVSRASSGFIPPSLPSPAERPPSGPGWVHEIKHEGFRIMVRRDAAGVRRLKTASQGATVWRWGVGSYFRIRHLCRPANLAAQKPNFRLP